MLNYIYVEKLTNVIGRDKTEELERILDNNDYDYYNGFDFVKCVTDLQEFSKTILEDKEYTFKLNDVSSKLKGFRLRNYIIDDFIDFVLEVQR